MAYLNSGAHAGKAVQQFSQVTGTATASGANQLIVTPGAGNRLVVKELMVQNESSTETTMILKSGTTAKWRAKLTAGMGLALSFADGEEWRLGTNEKLDLDLSGANSHGYSVRYFTEPAE